MEDWPADSEEPKQFSQGRLHDCDLCLLLVAFRRGYVLDDETRSITQLEYDAAVKQGIDVVPFLLDERAAWFREFDELDKEPGIRVWREQLEKRHGVKYFGSESRSIDLVGTLGRWLRHQTGLHIRLPTEWEWQQAASGGDPTCEYPWREWDAARCNSDESRLNRTIAVGMYPRGATKQGLLEMAGNVWEWCLNTHEQPEAPESRRIDDSDAARVIRGGSWGGVPGGLRVSYRYWDSADARDNFLGFRLAQDIP